MAYQPKSYRKFVAGAVTASFVATAIAPAASAAASFSDVPAGHQFEEAINALAADGTFIGQGGKFDMYGELTRRQAAVVFSRLIEGEGKMEQVFSDVPTTDGELTKAAYEVNEAGVMTGANGKLMPYSKLTRQQMAKIIVEHFDLEAKEDSNIEIKDLDKADASLRDYIQILADNGITVVADGNFRPTETVKRGQFAAFVYRAQQAVAGELAISSVTALDDASRYLSIEFNKAVSGLEASDITVQDADTLDRYGVKEVKLSSNGKTATVELFAKEDASIVLKDNQDYNVKVNVDGKVLEATFKRPAYTKSTITDIDVAERTFKVNYNGASVTIDVPTDVTFDFYDAIGREARVWFDENRDLVKSVFEEDQEVKESAIQVTKAVVTDADGNVTAGEVKLLSDGDKKYDLASDFEFYLNGNNVALGAKDVEYDFAKVVFNESGDVQTLVAYNAQDGILVEKVDGTYIFGYDNEDLDLDDYVIIKDGKQVTVADIKKDDYVFFNEDAEEDGVALVSSKTLSGEITDVYAGSFDIDGKNFDYTGEYLTSDNDVEPLDDDAAEKLQAGGKVTVYFNYKGDVVFVKGTEGAVEDKYATGILTDSLLPYVDSKGEGNLEVELKNKDGEKTYDFKVDSLDEVVIQTTNDEVELEVGEDYLATYPGAVALPAGTDLEIDEFRLETVDTDGTSGVTTGDDFYISAYNEAGTKLGRAVRLDAYAPGAVAVYTDGSVVKGLKFYDATAVTTNSNAAIESDDKYVDGRQLKDDTIVFDIDAARGSVDGDDVTVTTWGELKKRDVDIARNTADVYFNEDGVITHLAVYDGIDAADTTNETALITRVDKNTDGEIVRIQALVNGEAKTFTADKLTNSDITGTASATVSDIQEGSVVELEVNGDEVSEIVVNAGQTIAGTVTAVRVGEREVDVRTTSGTVTVELASNGEVYEATDADGDDFSVENIREISVNDKVVIGLAANGSRFAEAIVIASDAVVDVNVPTAPTASGYVLAANGTAAETITITVSEDLDLANGAAVTGFTTSTGTIASAVYNAANDTIVLTSTADGGFTTATTVTYTQASGNVEDKDGNELASGTVTVQ
ncbi:putative regulator of Ras-like GTPase activity (Roadblock/LC7/MglB family) [Bacillus fengqiuensis]|nr:putative regulator of Ras-like GTPase activity (Roadblock/LC7/MglB family) [Bacillus fengqiuensis]